jgi:hypothetical protein
MRSAVISTKYARTGGHGGFLTIQISFGTFGIIMATLLLLLLPTVQTQYS